MTNVVTKTKKVERVEILRRYIRLLESLKNLNNFNGMFEVFRALKSPPVRRMKESFAEIGEDYLARWETLKAMFSANGNYEAYHNAILSAGGVNNCLPAFDLIMGDLKKVFEDNFEPSKVCVCVFIFIYT